MKALVVALLPLFTLMGGCYRPIDGGSSGAVAISPQIQPENELEVAIVNQSHSTTPTRELREVLVRSKVYLNVDEETYNAAKSSDGRSMSIHYLRGKLDSGEPAMLMFSSSSRLVQVFGPNAHWVALNGGEAMKIAAADQVGVVLNYNVPPTISWSIVQVKNYIAAGK